MRHTYCAIAARPVCTNLGACCSLRQHAAVPVQNKGHPATLPTLQAGQQAGPQAHA